MSKIVYSTSATILYLRHVKRISMREIRRAINEPLRILNRLKNGKQKFTKQNYLDIVKAYPDLKHCIENFENVPLPK